MKILAQRKVSAQEDSDELRKHSTLVCLHQEKCTVKQGVSIIQVTSVAVTTAYNVSHDGSREANQQCIKHCSLNTKSLH